MGEFASHFDHFTDRPQVTSRIWNISHKTYCDRHPVHVRENRRILSTQMEF